MKRFLDTLKNIWAIEDLRNRILTTLLLVLIYRFGSYVVLPGINAAALDTLKAKGSEGLLGIFNMFVGGSFSRASVFALGIMPYISASIAVQLLGIAIPYFQKMQKEGESGRRKLNQITRIGTILITFFQAMAYVTYLKSQVGEAIIIPEGLFWLSTCVVLTAGTMFCLWLGEKITDKGIGNGVSLIIMVGIMARLPAAFFGELDARFNQSGGLIAFLIELVFLMGVIVFIILLVQGTRKIPVQYAKRIIGNKQYGGVRQYLPLKVNAAGVMPIIFAQALMFIPATILQFFPNMDATGFLGSLVTYTSFSHNLLFGLLVIIFTYFYTAIIINPIQMADEMKRNGGFIPGVKPGRKTSEYIDAIMSRVTLPGSIFLAFVAIMPAFANAVGINSQFASFFGGTSILIMVGTILDTLQQIESHLLMRHYDGLMKTGRIKGRSTPSAVAVAQG